MTGQGTKADAGRKRPARAAGTASKRQAAPPVTALVRDAGWVSAAAPAVAAATAGPWLVLGALALLALVLASGGVVELLILTGGWRRA